MNITKLLRKRKPSMDESLFLAERYPYSLLNKHHRSNLLPAERLRHLHDEQLSIRQQWERNVFGHVISRQWNRGCHRTDHLTT